MELYTELTTIDPCQPHDNLPFVEVVTHTFEGCIELKKLGLMNPSSQFGIQGDYCGAVIQSSIEAVDAPLIVRAHLFGLHLSNDPYISGKYEIT